MFTLGIDVQAHTEAEGSAASKTTWLPSRACTWLGHDNDKQINAASQVLWHEVRHLILGVERLCNCKKQV